MGWRVSTSRSESLDDTDTFERVRLYSAKSGKPLVVLSYHRDALHAIAFAQIPVSNQVEEEDSDDEVEKVAWLAAGGKETTISLWRVYEP